MRVFWQVPALFQATCQQNDSQFASVFFAFY